MAQPPVEVPSNVCDEAFDWHSMEFTRVKLQGNKEVPSYICDTDIIIYIRLKRQIHTFECLRRSIVGDFRSFRVISFFVDPEVHAVEVAATKTKEIPIVRLC